MFDFIRSLFRRKGQPDRKLKLVLQHDAGHSAVTTPSMKGNATTSQPRSVFARQAPAARLVERIPNDNRRRARWDDTERKFIEIDDDTAKAFSAMYERAEMSRYKACRDNDTRSGGNTCSDPSTDD